MMKTKRVVAYIEIEADEDEGETLPTDEEICTALAHSTAGEAMAEAVRGTVRMWLPTPEDLAADQWAAVEKAKAEA